jgi:hypothetical protein
MMTVQFYAMLLLIYPTGSAMLGNKVIRKRHNHERIRRGLPTVFVSFFLVGVTVPPRSITDQASQYLVSNRVETARALPVQVDTHAKEVYHGSSHLMTNLKVNSSTLRGELVKSKHVLPRTCFHPDPRRQDGSDQPGLHSIRSIHASLFFDNDEVIRVLTRLLVEFLGTVELTVQPFVRFVA